MKLYSKEEIIVSTSEKTMRSCDCNKAGCGWEFGSVRRQNNYKDIKEVL